MTGQETFTVPPPTLTVTPDRLDPTNANYCSYDSVSKSDSCTVTLTNFSAEGLLDWSPSSTFDSVDFNPQSSPLAPGAMVQVTISGLPPPCGQPVVPLASRVQPILSLCNGHAPLLDEAEVGNCIPMPLNSYYRNRCSKIASYQRLEYKSRFLPLTTIVSV